MQDNDPIIRNIQGMENQRLLGCALRWAMMFVAGMIALALIVRAAPNQSTRAAAAFAFTGLVLGFSTSYLTLGARKFLLVTFIAVPMMVSLAMFAMRTLFGYVEEYPLRLVAAPLFISAGFVVGQVRQFKL